MKKSELAPYILFLIIGILYGTAFYLQSKQNQRFTCMEELRKPIKDIEKRLEICSRIVD